jgi:hypothetical protein
MDLRLLNVNICLKFYQAFALAFAVEHVSTTAPETFYVELLFSPL